MLAISPISQLGRLRPWKLEPPWGTLQRQSRCLGVIALPPFLASPLLQGCWGRGLLPCALLCDPHGMHAHSLRCLDEATWSVQVLCLPRPRRVARGHSVGTRTGSGLPCLTIASQEPGIAGGRGTGTLDCGPTGQAWATYKHQAWRVLQEIWAGLAIWLCEGFQEGGSLGVEGVPTALTGPAPVVGCPHL